MPKITISKRSDNFHSQLEIGGEEVGTWEHGESDQEAGWKLIIQNAELLGLEIEFTPEASKAIEERSLQKQ